MTVRPSNRRRHSSRDRLLRAASQLFATQGYERTATSAIARQAGTSESQLVRYFGSKVGVLDALLDAAWADINAEVAQILATSDRSRDTIPVVARTVADLLDRDPDLTTILLFEGRRFRGGEERFRPSPGFVLFSDALRRLVRRSQANRTIAPALDARALTSALIGAAEAMSRDRLMARARGRRGLPEREIFRTLEAMVAGFSAGPPVRGAATRGRRRGRRRRV